MILDQAESPDFEQQIQSEAPTESKVDTYLHIVLLSPAAGSFPGNQREINSLFLDYWNISLESVALLGSPLVSSYHSRCVDIKGHLYLEICYNVTESLSYIASNDSPLDSSASISSSGPTDMVLHHQYEPIYFRHNISTGHTLYMLHNAKGDLRTLVHAIGKGLQGSFAQCTLKRKGQCTCQHTRLNPFAMHSAIMFHVLSTRSTELDNLVKLLLWIETQLHEGSIFEITDSDRFSKYVQLLHKMSRSLITLEHNNERDTSNIDHLLYDHSRLSRLAKRHHSKARINTDCHDRVRDDLLALRDFCDDRHRRILNLRQRTDNFITLLYNLITGHDSTVNLQIATQSARIARDARKDSMSMKIIAAVTLIYLPATF
ncbi:hypothetical protein AAEP93_001986 [Penicillium crustosum]